MSNIKWVRIIAITIITEVIFIAVIISLIFLVYTIASPLLSSMQISSAFDQAKSMMLDLDRLIQDVASQGRGGRKTFQVTLGAGTTLLDEDRDTIKWVLETDTMIVSPRSMQQIGNLIVGSNLGTDAYAGNYSSTDAHVLENEILKVFIKKIGSSASPQFYNTSDLLLGVYNKKISKWMPLERLEISVDNRPNSMNGTGYTELVKEGYSLPRGEVLAHINTSYTLLSNYTISFTLESGADFLILGAEQP